MNNLSYTSRAIYLYIKDGYEFPDEDYFLIRNIPYMKILTFIMRADKIEWGCVLRQIVSRAVDNVIHFDTNYVFEQISFNPNYIKICLNMTLSNCSLDKLPELSSINRSMVLKENNYESYYDIGYYLNMFEFFTQIIMLPIFEFLGLVFSIISIITLRNKKMSLFIFLELNCFFNIFYCLIKMSSLINRCIAVDGVYCPSYFFHDASQYFDIYVLKYLSSVIKFC